MTYAHRYSFSLMLYSQARSQARQGIVRIARIPEGIIFDIEHTSPLLLTIAQP